MMHHDEGDAEGCHHQESRVVGAGGVQVVAVRAEFGRQAPLDIAERNHGSTLYRTAAAGRT